MKPLDIIVLIVFSAAILATAISFSRTGKNMKSFFAGGANVPWWISGLSLFMGFFSSGTFVVWGSIAYDHGLVAMTILMTMCISGFIVGIFISPRWKKTGALTVAEYLSKRLGYNVQKVYTYLFLLLGLVSAANVLYPIARILNAATGLDIQLFILIIGAMIIVYTTVGGLWAVMVTDVLQFFILTTAVLIMLPLSLKQAGGFEQFVQSAPEGFFALFSDEYTLAFIVAFIFYHIIFIGGNWPYVQRFTSVSTPKNARKVAWMFGILYIFSTVIWMLPPMAYQVINPGLTGNQSEGAYLLVAKMVLPVGMLGLMLAAMLFATNSTANANLNMIAAVFTNDIYKRLFPNSSEKKIMIIARLSTAIAGIIMILFALTIKHIGGIVEVVLSVAAIAGGALLLPPIWSLFSRKQTGNSILTATLVSLGAGMFFKLLTPYLFDFGFTRAEEMAFGVGLPFAILLSYEIYAHVVRKEDDKGILIADITPISDEDQEAARKQNSYSLFIIGLALGIISVMMIAIGIFTDKNHELIFGIAAVILLISFLLLKNRLF